MAEEYEKKKSAVCKALKNYINEQNNFYINGKPANVIAVANNKYDKDRGICFRSINSDDSDDYLWYVEAISALNLANKFEPQNWHTQDVIYANYRGRIKSGKPKLNPVLF